MGTHADPSLVTFNYWITADEANLDPQSGGLKVWDVAAPLDWPSATGCASGSDTVAAR